MERTASSEKKRSSMSVENGQSGTTSSAKNQASVTIDAGKTDTASTANRRPSLTVTTGMANTTSTDKNVVSPSVETGKAESVFCDKRNSSPPVEIASRYERQYSLPVSTEVSASSDKKRWSIAVDTVQYKVQENETLLSIGARFGMGPSELKQLNKLMSNHIYTGQKLLIYAKNFSEAEEREKVQKLADEERERAEKQTAEEKYRARLRTEEANFAPFDSVSLQPSASDAPRSRHSSIIASEYSRNLSGRIDEFSDCVSEKSVDTIIRNIKKNRLRLEAKYVTDGQGVVSGTLLVTTNTVMFDPNVSDRLVMDRGSTSYVMVAPFEYVVRLAIVDDIAAMKWQRDSKTPSTKIYQGCDSKECETAAEIPSSDKDELLSSFESSSCTHKSDSPVIANGTCSPPTDSSGVSEDENAGGDLAKDQKTMHNGHFSSRQKCEETVEVAKSTGTIVLPPDNMSDYVNSDAYSNKTSHVLIKNRMNLCDMPLENSPRQGLFAQRQLSQASYGLFPIDDIEPVNDQCFPSSFSPLKEVVAAIRACNSPALAGSPMLHANSYKASPYDIASASPFRRKQSLSNMVEMSASPFGRKQSLSSMIESHAESASKLIPVYSAKSMQRAASSLTMGDSFCIPPGQNYIIDLSWEQFGQPKDEDGWCTSVCDLPPIPDEDAHQMEKPDFFISDDEDDDGEDTQSKPSEKLTEVKEKTSEVDVEKLLKSTDEIYKSLDVLIPRPATHYEDLPWYLCVVIGHPMPGKAGKVSSTEPYSTENMKPAYWFSIHRHDVHPLYEFIMTHFSNIYGSEDKVNPADRGLMVLSQELLNSKLEASSSICQFFLDESLNLNLPELSEESKILDDNQLATLNNALFPRAKHSLWKLVYTIERDGTSLQTLYRKMSYMAENDPPCVIIVRDSSRTAFGAVLSCTVKRSNEYFGNGESFLFSFRDGFKKYSASCINEYYGYGYRDSLCFGAHHGKCGLWLDGDLHHGRTQKCATYNNDVLTMTEDFYVHQLEAWCLI